MSPLIEQGSFFVATSGRPLSQLAPMPLGGPCLPRETCEAAPADFAVVGQQRDALVLDLRGSGWTAPVREKSSASGVRVAGAATSAAVTASMPVGPAAAVAVQEASVPGSAAAGTGVETAATLPAADPLDPKKTEAVKEHVFRTEFGYERFNELSSEQQDTFLHLAESLYKPGMLFFSKAGTDDTLISLLTKGRLAEPDAMGGTLLDNLARLSRQPNAPGFNTDFQRQQVLEQTMQAIANPDVIKQGHRGTCTATTVEYMNARYYPAEYARLVAGLVSQDGEVVLRNGDVMPRNDGLEKDDGSGRLVVSRVYQASMMDYANGPLIGYDNGQDINLPMLAHTEELFGLNKGLFAWEIKKAMEAVTPFKYECPTFGNTPEERVQFDLGAGSALAQGKPVAVTMRWMQPKPQEFGLHALLLEKIDGQYAYLRNPQGNDETAAMAEPELDLPRRQLLGDVDAPSGGHIRMTTEDFFERLFIYYAPR